MGMRDGYSKTSAVKSLTAATVTTTPDPDGVDLTNAGSVLLIAEIGQSGDTLSGSVYITLTVQESDDDSTWTDVVDPDKVVGATPNTTTGIYKTIDAAAEDEIVDPISYTGDKKYARILPELVGTHTNGTPIALSAVLMDLREAPPVA